MRTPAWDHPERLSTYIAARDEFLAQIKLSIATLTDGVVLNSVRLATPPDHLLKWFKTRSFMAGTPLIEFAYIEGIAEVDEAWRLENPDAEELICRAVAAEELSHPLNLVLLLTELAYPGCIDTLDFAMVSDAFFITSHQKKPTHTRLGFSDSEVWPPVRTLELHHVVTWANKRRSSHVRSPLLG